MSLFSRDTSTEDPGAPYQIHTDTMLVYFLSTLDVRVKWIESKGNLDQKETELLEEIKRRRNELRDGKPNLTEDTAWTEAYSLERLMALLEPANTLLPEIRRRIEQAAGEGVSTEPRLRTALTALEARALDTTKTPPEVKADEVPALRSLLLYVLEEIHWTIQRKFQARPLQKSATKKVVSVGIISFIAFILPYLIVYAGFYFSEKPPIKFWAWLPLYSALTAGLFGAFFSRLMYIQSYANQMSLGELKNAREYSSIILRGSVGMCGALIVFFFLQSGIVAGKLFPDFGSLGLLAGEVPLWATSQQGREAIALGTILPQPALALLVIWCFLAGFSERLVPSILSSTEGSFTEAAKGTKA